MAGHEKKEFVGFGVFSVDRRTATTGRNPRTGEVVKIASEKQANFISDRQARVEEGELVAKQEVGKPVIFLPPGHRLDTALRFVFPRKSYDEVFSQVTLDMREEMQEAYAEGCFKKAQWIELRYHLDVIITVLAYVPTTLAKRFSLIWRFLK